MWTCAAPATSVLPRGLLIGDPTFIRGISQHSHLFRAGWLRNVQAEQLHCSPSASESPEFTIGWLGGAGGIWFTAEIRGGRGGGTVTVSNIHKQDIHMHFEERNFLSIFNFDCNVKHLKVNFKPNLVYKESNTVDYLFLI